MPPRLRTIMRQRRQALDLSQRALAKRVGVSATYICLLEGGQRAAPSVATLKRLAKVLRVPVVKLLG